MLFYCFIVFMWEYVHLLQGFMLFYCFYVGAPTLCFMDSHAFDQKTPIPFVECA